MDFLKIRDLDSQSKGFNIKIKVLKKESERVVTIKKTAMQNRVAVFLVGDDTGVMKLNVWGVDIDKIPVGLPIMIQKSYVTEFNNTLHLNIGKYSKWSSIQDKIEVLKDEQSSNIKKKNRMTVKICNTVQKKKGINLDKVKVLEINNIRQVKVHKDGSSHEVADVLLGDETGCIKCSIWDEDIKKIKEDMIIKIHNAYISRYKGIPQLNLSRFSKYEILQQEDLDINIENNLSVAQES
ncbi:MAG: hypothetical protein ACTSO9_12105 [Candidatus Helarchaeota archaeon]